MERTDILELMSTLKLYGMRAAYDEVMNTGIKRRHEPPHIVGEHRRRLAAARRSTIPGITCRCSPESPAYWATPPLQGLALAGQPGAPAA